MTVTEQPQALKNAYVMEYTESHKINSENIKEELTMDTAEKIREMKNEYHREWYAKNIESQKAYKKEYRADHKEKTKAYATAYWERKALETN